MERSLDNAIAGGEVQRREVGEHSGSRSDLEEEEEEEESTTDEELQRSEDGYYDAFIRQERIRGVR